MTNFDAVIIADGDFPIHATALKVLSTAPYLCACDGAAAECLRRDIVPDAIVGDGDSLSAELKQLLKLRLHLESEQDDNDLTKATRHCMRLGHRRIAYLGATGKREDHTLGNISLMARYLHEFHLQPVMFTNHGYFVAAEGDATFATFARQQVSIFNISCSKLESEGLKWQSYAYSSMWQGTLNEALSTTVSMHADGCYIMYFTHEAKDAT